MSPSLRTGLKNTGLKIGIYLSLVIGLSACKATTIGTTVESAIAPKQILSTSPDLVNNSANPINKNLTLPRDFSREVPIYPKAVLQNLEKVSANNSQNIFSLWTTADSVAQVSSFYEDAFTKQQWRLILRSPDGNFVVQKADLILTLSIQTSDLGNLNPTTISLQYLRDRQLSQQLTPDLNIAVNPANPTNPTVPTDPIQPNQVSVFSDLASLPEALRSPILDLQKLGTISPKQTDQFKPNDLVQRREYVRWLVNTNNRLYANRPTRQIRLADANTPPTFADIPASDPDFAVIQAMVNAGLISTNPTLGATSRRFRPNEPLNRETLLQWKIPLDVRSTLPTGNLEAVKQVWGFQDSDRITPANFKYVLADFKLGDFSNLRRSFGYTTLFQPQKYVTRAEAAAALWYFGTPEDGLSAQNSLQNALERSPDPALTPKPSDPSPTPEPTPAKPSI